uniref:G protein gamma domain-containing protein n=1 Tax=Strongyloides stercoralis TaxID=6248 RepID=A0A0K0E2B1_STRER
MADYYECIESVKSNVPPPPPKSNKKNMNNNILKSTCSEDTSSKAPPPLNGKPHQEKSNEPIPSAPRLAGNPLTTGDKTEKKKKKKGCCTIL